MAEIVNLFEVNIDTEQATKDLAETQKSVDALKQEIKELKKAEGDNSIAIAEATSQLKAEQAELRTNTKLTQNAIKAKNAQEGSIDQLRTALSTVSIQWARLSKEERENSEEGKRLTKQKLELTEALRAEEKATGDSRRGVGDYAGGIKDAIDGTGLLNTSLLTLAANPVVLVITAIVGLFKLFQAAVQRSEKATKSFNTILAVFEGVMDGILNALVPVVEFIGDGLTKALDSPKESIIELGKTILDKLIAPFKTAIKFGKAFGAVLTGDLDKAQEFFKDGVQDVVDGVNNTIDAFKNVGNAAVEFGKSIVENTEKAINANIALANSERELLRIAKQFELQQLTFQKNAEDQRQIRDDEARSIQERIEANKELGNILDQQLQKELELANKQLRFAELRKIADGDTLETEEAIFDARIKIAEINERIAGQRSEQLTNENSLLREQEELEIAELARIAEQADAELAIEIEKNLKLQEAEQQRIDNLNEARIVDLENKRIQEQEYLNTKLNAEREFLELERQQEIAYAESIGADTTLIEQKYADARQEINRAETNAKLALAGGFAADIAKIAGEGTAVGKAAAVTQTTISTFQAAQGSYAALSPIPIVGPALGAAAAGAAVVSGIANVKKILATKSGLPGEGKVSGGGVSASVPQTSSVRATVADDVNSGIISREAGSVSTGDELNVQPTLVTDQVTVDQNKQAANNQTAVI